MFVLAKSQRIGVWRMRRQQHSQESQGGHVVEDVRGKGGDVVVQNFPGRQLGST